MYLFTLLKQWINIRSVHLNRRVLAIALAVILALMFLVGCERDKAGGSGTTSKTGALFLDITQPEDESIVTSASVQVKGKTVSQAVVSINGELTEVDNSGRFTTTVALEEGPNLIDVIATDREGGEVQKSIVIIYAP
ncbi:MAG: hypothetical protein HY664_00660 [Chloroflexi bacterium]|nr:hypothetical protein [Chloroflexota bacterium]